MIKFGANRLAMTHGGMCYDDGNPYMPLDVDFAKPTREPPEILLVLIAALLFCAVVGSYVLCNSARAQQTPVPDARFTPGAAAAADEIPISSAFGVSFPVLQKGQILVQRHLYTAAIDPVAKQPVWVAYAVRPGDWDTENKLDRNFHTPDRLKPFCLEADDYAKSGFEMGHMYGLQFVLASQYAAEVNEMSIVAAQRGDLNKGPWLGAENNLKRAAEVQQRPVNVMTGLLWLETMPALETADEPHRLASHCWMIFSPDTNGAESAYLMPQNTARSAKCAEYSIEPADLRAMISDRWTCPLESDGGK